MDNETKMKKLKRLLLINEDENKYDLLLQDAIDEAEYASIHIALKIVKETLKQ